ncbi:hypothetical protein [Candidatus Albibeggiatoa sp. nov. BB20]|uniref:hypothetical protein n=1 Tax=Candidatus Albibeggiatoa sp. nov. BB20 TaxID=3162723 RepID=UPI0033653829
MYAIEFETDITSRFIEIKDYESFKNKHVKVIILADSKESSVTTEDIALKNLFKQAKNIKTSENINIDRLSQEMNHV